jgi:predicted DNA-binding transcriptional regulator AlpA
MERIEKNTKLMSAKDVKELFGGISDMSLWRWLQDEKLDFPRPVVIQRRRFFRAAEIEAFIERRAEAGNAA